jgi:hypothetical protein
MYALIKLTNLAGKTPHFFSNLEMGHFMYELVIQFWHFNLIYLPIYLPFPGSYAGAVLGMSLSGALTQWLGWQACFYFYGESM